MWVCLQTRCANNEHEHGFNDTRGRSTVLSAILFTNCFKWSFPSNVYSLLWHFRMNSNPRMSIALSEMVITFKFNFIPLVWKIKTVFVAFSFQFILYLFIQSEVKTSLFCGWSQFRYFYVELNAFCFYLFILRNFVQ